MYRIVRKLGNSKGESIAELLISILVSVLGITLLAIMIQTSSKLILSSTVKIQEYTVEENKIVNKKGDPVDDDEDAIIIDNENKVYKLYKGSGNGIKVNLYEMTLGTKKIVAFEKK